MKPRSVLMLLAILFSAGSLMMQSSQAPVAESALGAPTLTSPPNGATLSTMGPTLEWINPAGTTQYHFTVAPASDDGPGVDLHLGSPDTSFTLPPPPTWYGMLPDMTYTWRVRVSDSKSFIALDDPAWSPWSQAFTFHTPAASGDTILLRSPADGAAIVGFTPTLIWNDSNVYNWYYEVQVSPDPRFGPEAFLYWELRHAAATFPPRSYTIPSAYPLQPNMTYYWRVRSRIQGDGQQPSWGAAHSFITGGGAPAVATPTPAPASTSCTWTGTWDTDWNKLHLTQTGSTVSGSYEYNQGRVTGTVSGNQFTGRWTEAPTYQEPYDAGGFVWTIAAGCSSFTGTWGYGTERSAGTWNGTRASTTVPAPTPTATAAPSATASWAGTWDTDYGVMVLTQTTSAVSGTYTWNDGKLAGSTTGGVLSGRWSESPSYQPPSDAGDIEFRMSADGNSFTGTWGYGYGAGKPYVWNGKRRTSGGAATPTATPRPSTTSCSWAGTWSTTYNTMRLTQSGSSVAGTYDYNSGRISGTASGATLSGRWDENTETPGGDGGFVLTMSADCKSFFGNWGYGSSILSGVWNGTRTSTTAPTPVATATTAPATPTATATAPATVSGCSWTGTWSTTYETMRLTQSGSSVAGTYDYNSGRISGTASGATLSGRWDEGAETSGGDGGFSWTMSADCNSFSGSWGSGSSSTGSSWTGTRTSTTAPTPVATATTAPATSTATATTPATVSGCSWTGTWSTTYNTMRLTQTGTAVTGTYEYNSGRISGTASGATLSGRWDEGVETSGGDGGFSWTMSADCKSFSGTWGSGSASTGSAWTGTRVS